MTTADNVARLDDAMAERKQITPISMAQLHEEVSKRRAHVLDRLAVVRVMTMKNEQERERIRAECEAKLAALADDTETLNEEASELNQMADAMLNEMHAFDRLMQGR